MAAPFQKADGCPGLGAGVTCQELVKAAARRRLHTDFVRAQMIICLGDQGLSVLIAKNPQADLDTLSVTDLTNLCQKDFRQNTKMFIERTQFLNNTQRANESLEVSHAPPPTVRDLRI